MLDEADRRREDVLPELCCPVRLMDDQEWLFRAPVVTIRPVFQDGVLVRCWQDLSYDDGTIDGLLEQIAANVNTGTTVAAALAVAARVLQLSYDLDDEELKQVLWFSPGMPACERVLAAVIEVTSGQRLPGSESGETTHGADETWAHGSVDY